MFVITTKRIKFSVFNSRYLVYSVYRFMTSGCSIDYSISQFSACVSDNLMIF